MTDVGRLTLLGNTDAAACEGDTCAVPVATGKIDAPHLGDDPRLGDDRGLDNPL